MQSTARLTPPSTRVENYGLSTTTSPVPSLTRFFDGGKRPLSSLQSDSPNFQQTANTKLLPLRLLFSPFNGVGLLLRYIIFNCF